MAFKIILIAAGILIVVSLASGWIFLSTLDVKKYIPQLAEVIVKATGRQLKVGEARIKISFLKLGLELKDVSLSENTAFSDKILMTIPSVFLSISVGEAIFKQMLVVSELNISSPDITIIRMKDGSFNVTGMVVSPEVNSAGSTPASPSGAMSNAASSAVSSAALPGLIIRTISLHDAVLHFRDLSFDPEIKTDINKISFSVNNFSLSDPFDFVLSAALFSKDADIDVKGRAGLDLSKAGVHLESLRMVLTIDQIIAEQLNNALPMIKSAGFKKGAGAVTMDVRSAVISGGKLESLDAEIQLALKSMTLVGVNILASGLNSLSMFPGLADSVITGLPPETQADINNGITVVDRMDVLAQANKDQLTIKKAEIATRDLIISTTGSVQLTGPLDMESKIFMSSKISDVVIAKAPELGGLKDDQGSISIPFKLKGTITSPAIRLEFKSLTKKLFVGRGKQELEKVLGDPSVGDVINKLFSSFKKSK